MPLCGHDTLKTRRTLKIAGQEFDYFSLKAASEAGLGDISRLPYSMKVLLENLLRYEDGRSVTVDDVKACAAWIKDRRSDREIAYRPARVLMQDFTGVPAVVDLAAMRDAVTRLGGDPQKINPLSPVDLVIDHSVMIDHFGAADSLKKNMDLEFERNGERYEFLRWGQKAFRNFRAVPPGAGICHQINIEHLARVAWTGEEGKRTLVYPDTCVGTDSHTTMVNGLGVLGWGVGGIEAEAAMLGQPVSMLIPEVVGFKLTGKLREGMTATDLVLTVTQMLRKKGVVGKFVEFYGSGLDNLSLADRATIGNMAPEYGATCGIFPVDEETLNYLRLTGRPESQIELVKLYAMEQGMWRTPNWDPVFTDTLELDMNTVEASLAGPKRPQDRVALSGAAKALKEVLTAEGITDHGKGFAVPGTDYELNQGDVVIAAITSCTNTSNPSVLIAAGLVAKKAIEKGLKRAPWVKSSLAPGSQVVQDYLEKAGLQKYLDQLGFNIAGFGCTTCIGNSGPLADPIATTIDTNKMVVSAVLSGNRNFEGRISPHVRANWLASPPLVVAYALLGNMQKDITTEPLGTGSDGKPVYLKDIWPTTAEIQSTVASCVTRAMFESRYADVWAGPRQWQAIKVGESQTYSWNNKSTYVQNPPYFVNIADGAGKFSDIKGARPLAILGDSVTTDHISPAGSIKTDSPAGKYLIANGVSKADFNSYGARRGNHEVMMRGTFANIRIKNEMVPGIEGGITKHIPSGEVMAIYDASMKYQAEKTPLVVIAGKEYGTGSSRDWAAKGTNLLGVKAVLVESFERIHRSNLVGMGVLPLQFKDGTDRKTLKLDGTEVFDISGIGNGIKPRQDVQVTITRADGSKQTITVLCRIDTADEVEYYRHGGILQYVLRSLVA
ncbi:aconitate hydratase AcnA [Haematospirillum jordaniae]|uniref:Aconitate hydratase n=1 Tax=Haematospirillum jordaniae TaxID=1549855 RepID=A0A143DCY1_9PROT|nr:MULTISPECIES: aconitate hydratase AcnA [Haematospirillum]AMW34582.1 aconitate hydratase [Haematospirillum jordaniae]NKD46198.1 aconitate hydratase AcnA [Haematospirillum jordaniae]NKD58108.1 aconitate hydratase AcnA [Haematospirillum jordaniae]NKD60225.1 aconitate hydratase AcnA [Haematospirillum jordaniae]NKD68149.1 aconitate hydratase AcnA [Haematospirillum jordaniae]